MRRPPPGWQLVPLGLTLLLWPVILLDFSLFSREISALRPSTRQLGGSFAISAVVLLLLIFGHVFTTVYDYIPLVGPLFRDRFYVDRIYDNFIIRYFQDAFSAIIGFFDEFLINGLIVGGLSRAAESLGNLFRKVQSGSLQGYAFVFGLGVILVVYFTAF